MSESRTLDARPKPQTVFDREDRHGEGLKRDEDLAPPFAKRLDGFEDHRDDIYDDQSGENDVARSLGGRSPRLGIEDTFLTHRDLSLRGRFGEGGALSALIVLHDRQATRLAMDSLAVSADKKRPVAFVNKIFPFPQLDSVVVGTGALRVIADWVRFLTISVTWGGVRFLNELTPDQLPSVNEEAIRLYDSTRPDDLTTTIYLFGYDREEERMRGFAYRSKNGFVSEELDYGVIVKPGGQGVGVEFVRARQAYLEQYENEFDAFLHASIVAMKMQKQQDEALAIEDQVGIGGEIYSISVTRSEQLLLTSHRFDDYAAALASIQAHSSGATSG